MKIFVVDGGTFGTAFAIMLGRAKKHEVTLLIRPYSQAQKDLYYNLRAGTQKTNYLYLPDVEIPENVLFTDNFEAAVDADVILLAVPSKHIWEPFSNVTDCIEKNRKMIIALLSKGVRPRSNQPLGLDLENHLNTGFHEFHNFAAISGPTFAKDLVVSGKSHVAAVASHNLSVIKKLKEMVKGTGLELEGMTDLLGVSWGGCAKNTYALGHGICDGLGYSQEMLDKYLELAFGEMRAFLEVVGVKSKTISGPAVKEDFYMTAQGESRNRVFGEFVAEYHSIEEIEAEADKRTVEGFEAMKAIWKIAHENKLFAPLLYGIHSVACLGASPNVFKGYFNVASGKGWTLSND